MIQLQGVTYAYSDSALPALQEIDLTVPDGQWLLLAGPSGGGKSTLLYLVNGLIPHVLGGEKQGSVQVNGVVPADVPLRELSRQVGTVFQNPESQLFMLRVHEDVAFGCENLGLPPAETNRPSAGSLSLRCGIGKCLASPAVRNSDWRLPVPWQWAAARSYWTSRPATLTNQAERSC
jgi:energy-coupling factor transporter ATP-binding protein EcfA2